MGDRHSAAFELDLRIGVVVDELEDAHHAALVDHGSKPLAFDGESELVRVGIAGSSMHPIDHRVGDPHHHVLRQPLGVRCGFAANEHASGQPHSVSHRASDGATCAAADHAAGEVSAGGPARLKLANHRDGVVDPEAFEGLVHVVNHVLFGHVAMVALIAANGPG